MSKAITREQAIQGLLTLGTKVDWNKVNGDIFQQIIEDRDGRTGPEFTAFLQNYGKVIVGELKIVKVDRSSPFDPAKFIGKGWTIEEQDERSLALSEVDLTKVRFEDMLKSGENSIQGEEKLNRLKKAGHIRLDAKFFQTLWENRQMISASWKEKIGGNIRYIVFDGTVLRNSPGNRYVLCLYWDGDIWIWNYCWLGNDWGDDGPSAVLAS
jgi:hypothetical protein